MACENMVRRSNAMMFTDYLKVLNLLQEPMTAVELSEKTGIAIFNMRKMLYEMVKCEHIYVDGTRSIPRGKPVNVYMAYYRYERVRNNNTMLSPLAFDVYKSILRVLNSNPMMLRTLVKSIYPNVTYNNVLSYVVELEKGNIIEKVWWGNGEARAMDAKVADSRGKRCYHRVIIPYESLKEFLEC